MIEVREKLVNASTGDVRPGNLLPVKLGDDVEQITVDGDTLDVKYYYVQTPDTLWRKTEYYEEVGALFSIVYLVNNNEYHREQLRAGDAITPYDFDNSDGGYEWSGWIEEIPEVMPSENVIIHGTATPKQFTLFYVIDGLLVQYFGVTYNSANYVSYNPPSKDGYSFSGWSSHPDRMPAHDVTLTGSYIKNTQYILTYMIDNSVYATESHSDGEVLTALEEPEIETGYTWTGWIDFPYYMPSENWTVNSSLIPNQYALDYYVDSSLWKSINYDYKASIVSETYTPPTGKVFSGWQNEPETMPAINHYIVSGRTATNFYDITFMSDSSTVYASYKLAHGDHIPELEIQKEGYVFLGWNPEVPQYVTDSSITTYAQFTSVDCSVNWYMIDNNDTTTARLLTTQSYVYGDDLIVPEYPDRIGWDSSVLETRTRVFSDMDCYINYDRLTYQIYYYVDESLLKTASYAYDASVDTTETAEKYGYTFVTWDPSVPSTMPAYDISTYAQFDINSYKIYYYVDSSCIKIETYNYNEDISPVESVTKEGYNFTGWYPVIPNRMPNSDFITSAQFIKISSAYWYIDSSLIYSAEYAAGTVVNSPTPPEAGYVYDWNGNDTFTMGTIDVSIYGTKLVLDSSIFGISLEQYHESVTNPTVELGFCGRTGYGDADGSYYDLSTDPNLYGFIYLIDYKLMFPTVHTGMYWHHYTRLPIVLGYQISSDGVNWTDTNKIQLSTNVLNKTVDANGIVHMPEFSSFKYVRLTLKSIEGQWPDDYKWPTNYRELADHYGIVIGSNYIDMENSMESNAKKSILVFDNKQEGCKFQTFGDYDSFYSHLEELISERLGLYKPLHGIILSLANNVCHAHRTYEYTAHNFITSGYRIWGSNDFGMNVLDSNTCCIETTPVNKATDLYQNCYHGRWSYCTKLTTAPELPATTVPRYAYARMFEYCRSLKTAPELPATALEVGSYLWMFRDCSSLTTAPELPATNLTRKDHCYGGMFSGCTSLTTPPELPATTNLPIECYQYMFSDCTSLTTAPELPAEIVPALAYQNMFSNCDSLYYPPIIKGKYFGNRACELMFYDCKNLRHRAVIDVIDASSGYDYGMYERCYRLED